MDPSAAANLVTGERVVYRTELHWFPTYLPAMLVGGFALFLALILGGAVGGVGLVGPFLLLIFVAGPLAAAGYVRLRTSQFSVTDKRVSIKVGVVRGRSLETLLAKVEGVSIAQGPIGSVMGYGTIVVNGVGGTKEPFVGVTLPQQFRLAVQQEVARVAA